MSSLPIIEEFTRYLSDERHFSPYTARCYGADLRQYIDFLSTEQGIELDTAREQAALNARRGPGGATDVVGVIRPGTLTDVICTANADLIRGFLSRLGEQQYSAATMARKIATLRSFYKWADRRGLAKGNPMTLIRTPRQGKRLPKAITIEQIEKLLASPGDADVLGRRDRALHHLQVLERLCGTGCEEYQELRRAVEAAPAAAPRGRW